MDSAHLAARAIRSLFRPGIFFVFWPSNPGVVADNVRYRRPPSRYLQILASAATRGVRPMPALPPPSRGFAGRVRALAAAQPGLALQVPRLAMLPLSRYGESLNAFAPVCLECISLYMDWGN